MEAPKMLYNLNEDIMPFGEPTYLVVMFDVSKESKEEFDAEVEACIIVEGSEDIKSKSMNLFQNATQDYTFFLQQNNSLQYTHVEENNCTGIMESSVSRNATIEASVEV